MELRLMNNTAVLQRTETLQNASNDDTTIEDAIVEEVELPESDISKDQFIHANTMPVMLEELRSRCIIPVFSKDNESTISHTEFIEITNEVAGRFFKGERLLNPSIRVSHSIKGRIPEAMGNLSKS